MLLQKMLATPRAKDQPLRACVEETMLCVPQKSIPAYIETSWRNLEGDALAILAERKALGFEEEEPPADQEPQAPPTNWKAAQKEK
jgi:hypothetical protein